MRIVLIILSVVLVMDKPPPKHKVDSVRQRVIVQQQAIQGDLDTMKTEIKELIRRMDSLKKKDQ